MQVAFTVIGDGGLGADGNTFKRRLTEMSLRLPKEVVVLVTPWALDVPRLWHSAKPFVPRRQDGTSLPPGVFQILDYRRPLGRR